MPEPRCCLYFMIGLAIHDDLTRLYWLKQMFFLVLLLQAGRLENRRTKCGSLWSVSEVIMLTVEEHDSSMAFPSDNQLLQRCSFLTTQRGLKRSTLKISQLILPCGLPSSVIRRFESWGLQI